MINFPNKKNNTTINTSVNTDKKNNYRANLGMNFEKMINESCEYYRVHNQAIIHKKPIPIKIVKVDYPSRSRAKIIEAYYQVASTTDYNGIYKQRYIDFEAKETSVKNYLGLEYIHDHQVKHLVDIVKHGGIGFFVIYFKVHQKVFLYDLKDFLFWWDNRNNEGARKSIPYTDIEEKGVLIEDGYLPRLNLLKAIDEKYFK